MGHDGRGKQRALLNNKARPKTPQKLAVSQAPRLHVPDMFQTQQPAAQSSLVVPARPALPSMRRSP